MSTENRISLSISSRGIDITIPYTEENLRMLRDLLERERLNSRHPMPMRFEEVKPPEPAIRVAPKRDYTVMQNQLLELLMKEPMNGVEICKKLGVSHGGQVYKKIFAPLLSSQMKEKIGGGKKSRYRLTTHISHSDVRDSWK